MTVEHLKTVRNRFLDKDPIVLAATHRLLKRAEVALREGPFSVINKTSLPPSGNKRDYYSIGPYWWPNPDTPDGLPYIRRDGLINPERESAAMDSKSLESMSRNVCTLLLAQYLTGDWRFGNQSMQLIRVWFIHPDTRMNPHLRFGQAIPGVTDGRGIGIIDTEEWVGMIRLLMACPPPQMTASDALALKKWFDEYLDWLLASELGCCERMEPNNHGTWYDAQVTWFAMYCNRLTCAREVLRGVLDRRIARQIDPDGKQPLEWSRSRPMTYTCFNLRALMELADAGDFLGINLWRMGTSDGRSIKRAVEWVMPYTTRVWNRRLDPPDTRNRILPLLRRAAWALDEDRFEKAIQTLPRDQWWSLRFNLLWPTKNMPVRVSDSPEV